MRTFYKGIQMQFVCFNTIDMDAERIREHVLDAHMAGLKKGLAIQLGEENLDQFTRRLEESFEGAVMAITDTAFNMKFVVGSQREKTGKELERYFSLCHSVAETMLEAVAKGIPFSYTSFGAFCTVAYEQMYQDDVPTLAELSE